jgi:hypothetical protein
VHRGGTVYLPYPSPAYFSNRIPTRSGARSGTCEGNTLRSGSICWLVSGTSTGMDLIDFHMKLTRKQTRVILSGVAHQSSIHHLCSGILFKFCSGLVDPHALPSIVTQESQSHERSGRTATSTRRGVYANIIIEFSSTSVSYHTIPSQPSSSVASVCVEPVCRDSGPLLISVLTYQPRRHASSFRLPTRDLREHGTASGD